MFTTDLSSYAQEFWRKGYINIQDAISPDFLRYCDEQLASKLETRESELHRHEIAGKKKQCLFELPEDPTIREALYETVGIFLRVASKDVTLSERHYKLYSPSAPPFPIPHKDRRASEIAIGIPLQVHAESRLFLFPNQMRSTNPYASNKELREHSDVSALPEFALKDIQPIRIYSKRGDAVFFLGSSMFHERENAADAIILYLKFNSFGDDPLNEDIAL